jgi:lysophospholipase L1-like esterase
MRWLIFIILLTGCDKMSIRMFHSQNKSGGAFDFTNANLRFDGNSWTNYGEPCFPGESYGAGAKYPNQLMALSPWNSNGATMVNLATSGQTTEQMIDGGACAMDGSGVRPAATTFIDSGLEEGRPNILVAIEGGNELFFKDKTINEAETYASLVDYYTARRAAGWKVVAGTILYREWTGASVTPGGDTWPEYNAKVDNINALIRANWATFADALADINAAPELDDPTDLTYYVSDQVHPNGAGRAVIASIVSAAILTIN